VAWLVLVSLIALALPVWAGDPVETGLAYLSAQQQPDGGFTNGFSEGSDLGTTCDVILAIAAGGQDASTWVSDDDHSPLDYLYTQIAEGEVDKLGPKAKITLALLATGQDPADFAGHDLIAELNAAYDETTCGYGETMFDHALTLLALSDADRPIPDEAVRYLLDNQLADGAWALFSDTDSAGDTNTTALAIQALIATDQQQGIDEAFAYLHGVQNDDGGFPYQSPSDYGTGTDANSTALVIQALLAAGESLSDWSPAGASPLDALMALYDSDSGAFLWQMAVPGPNVLATAQAIPAIASYTFVSMPHVEAGRAPEPETAPITLPQSGGLGLAPVILVAMGILGLGLGLTSRHR
jgi:hypothetical protein